MTTYRSLSMLCSFICAHHRRCHHHHRRRHHSPPSLGCTTSPPSCPWLPPGWCEPHQRETHWEEQSPAFWRPSSLCALNGPLLLFRNIVARTKRCVQRTLPFGLYFLRTKLFVGHAAGGGGGVSVLSATAITNPVWSGGGGSSAENDNMGVFT